MHLLDRMSLPFKRKYTTLNQAIEREKNFDLFDHKRFMFHQGNVIKLDSIPAFLITIKKHNNKTFEEQTQPDKLRFTNK